MNPRPYTRTSPSQITGYQACPRRWYYSSIERRPQPQSPEAVEGEVLHKQRENYQIHGTRPEHPSVLLTLDWAPAPGTPGIIVEAKTTELYIAGLNINGRVDYTDARDPTQPKIIDWKSKSNLKYLFSKRKLTTDVQLSVYGAWAFSKWAEATSVVLGHGYIVRDAENPGAKLVTTDPLSREHIDGVVAELVPTIENMKRDSQALSAADVAADTSACWSFGTRCPYYEFCPRPEQTFAGMFGSSTETDVTLLETLKLSPGASEIPDPAQFVGTTTATAAPSPSVTTTVTTAPTATPADDTDIIARLRALIGTTETQP